MGASVYICSCGVVEYCANQNATSVLQLQSQKRERWHLDRRIVTLQTCTVIGHQSTGMDWCSNRQMIFIPRFKI